MLICLFYTPKILNPFQNIYFKMTSTFAYLKLHNRKLSKKTALVYHSHLGKVNQVVFGVVWSTLLNECQVCEVHPQVWHTWRVTTSRHISTLLDNVNKVHIWLKYTFMYTVTKLMSQTTQDKSNKPYQVYFFKASRRFLNLPSDETNFCSLSITVLVYGVNKNQKDITNVRYVVYHLIKWYSFTSKHSICLNSVLIQYNLIRVWAYKTQFS